MLKAVVDFALKQRVFVAAITLMVAIAGMYAFSGLPVQAFPDVQDVQVQIITLVPGQAPEEVERAVTLPIERTEYGVPKLTQLRSISMTGLSVVTMTFADGTDDYFARAQVLEKLSEITLPTGIQPQLAPLSTAVGEIYRYIVEAPADMPLDEVRAIQDWTIEPALRQVPGVADINGFGGAIREYQVHVHPDLLRKYNLSLEQVGAALQANSVNTGGGLLKRGDEDLVVRAIGLYQTIDDVGRVPVAVFGGQPVLVRDIGEATIGTQMRYGIVGYNRQDDVVEGIVVMTKGEDPAKVITTLKARIAEVQKQLPPGVSIRPIYDRTTLVNHTVDTVSENLCVGAALVIAVLLIFLHNWRAALIVASVIPLALLTAFLLMRLRGIDANLISLGSVDFGIMIDSAVVLVEALMVRLAFDAVRGEATAESRHAVLAQTATQLGSPILFSKAIIILAFLPIFTFQRVEGKIFAPMALTLTFALAGAVIFTLTLVPALLSWATRGPGLEEKHDAWMERLRDRYRRDLGRWAHHPRLVIGTAIGLLLVALALAPLLGSEFLPKLDEGNIWLTIDLPPSTALAKTKEVERHVRKILLSYPEVTQVITQTGRPDDGTDPKGPNNIEIMADLKPRGEWPDVDRCCADKDALIRDMEKKIHAMPGVPTNFSQYIEDNVEEALSGVKGEIAVKVSGPSLDVLQAKGGEIASVLRQVPGSADVEEIQIGGQTELDITLDRAALSRYGINVNDAATTVATALGSAVAGNFYEGNRIFNVTLRLDEAYRNSVEKVSELPVSLPGGAGTVPLGQLAHIEERQGAAKVLRESGSRIVAIKVNVLGRDQGSFVAEAMRRVADEVKLPGGYRIAWGGQFENQRRATARLMIIVPLSLVGIFILLFWAFRSIRKALLILATVPFTLIGGLAGLALAGLHLSISAAVGFIAVAGISVQNGVIMVEQIVALRAQGHAMEDAVLEGAASRLRAILMTALMAGLGLLPAALSHGIGSETQRPFAVVIVGGIVSATLIALNLLPLLYEAVVGAET
ncbi:MAG: efflux RND transporter permease subunit [Proteobacteria bacterium]|uniref:efflux RND transporter permease subunit n=1 Tax=Rudaea sp. TaxID=2136325 RepID=UPI001DE32E92|nr:efflux RND transporter permease subunit [Pseudomonadota bacterium]MBS0568785.1 efflux RND transporter permease subunit [Pseudomonadota bacterium]